MVLSEGYRFVDLRVVVDSPAHTFQETKELMWAGIRTQGFLVPRTCGQYTISVVMSGGIVYGSDRPGMPMNICPQIPQTERYEFYGILEEKKGVYSFRIHQIRSTDGLLVWPSVSKEQDQTRPRPQQSVALPIRRCRQGLQQRHPSDRRSEP